jgi:hypothetical protein
VVTTATMPLERLFFRMYEVITETAADLLPYHPGLKN